MFITFCIQFIIKTLPQSKGWKLTQKKKKSLINILTPSSKCVSNFNLREITILVPTRIEYNLNFLNEPFKLLKIQVDRKHPFMSNWVHIILSFKIKSVFGMINFANLFYYSV